MIDKDKYEEAKKLVHEYESQMNLSLVEDRVCCVCEEKKIKAIEHSSTNALKQEQGMWNDGVVERINFGYGSAHDMDSYYIAICDNCIVALETKKFATNLRDIRKSVKNYDAIMEKVSSSETNFNENEMK